MQHHDCLIIGGGLLGMLTAHELMNEGMQVCLVERGLLGRESSWAGGGILSFLHPWLAAEPLVALAEWSQRHYPGFSEHLATETGVNPEYLKSGLLVLDPEDPGLIEDWGHRCHRQVIRMSVQDLAGCESQMGHTWQTGMLLPDIAQIRNPRLLRALSQSLRDRGLSILEHTEVRDIRQDSSGHMVVDIDNGPLEADRVAVTSGAWSARLLKMANIQVNVEPVRGQMLLYKTEPGTLKHILLHGDRYMIPRQDGHILMGSTVEHEGFDKSATLDVADSLRAAARLFLPMLSDRQPVAHWAGLRPGSPGGVPMIGAVPAMDGLFVNTGHFRNGVLLGLASARLLADIMLGRSPFCDPKPYQIH